jgi:hypothetical protein
VRGEKWSPRRPPFINSSPNPLLPSDERELIPTGSSRTFSRHLDRAITPCPPHLTSHQSHLTSHVRGSAEHNLDCSLNGCGLGLYAGAELIFGGGFKGDRVGTMIEGKISGFGHHRELFVPDTTFD